MNERHADVRRSATVRYDTDCCPACASTDTQPYAVIVGASEQYGYLCLACGVSWPVIQATGAATARRPPVPVRHSG